MICVCMCLCKMNSNASCPLNTYILTPWSSSSSKASPTGWHPHCCLSYWHFLPLSPHSYNILGTSRYTVLNCRAYLLQHHYCYFLSEIQMGVKSFRSLMSFSIIWACNNSQGYRTEIIIDSSPFLFFFF